MAEKEITVELKADQTPPIRRLKQIKQLVDELRAMQARASAAERDLGQKAAGLLMVLAAGHVTPRPRMAGGPSKVEQQRRARGAGRLK